MSEDLKALQGQLHAIELVLAKVIRSQPSASADSGHAAKTILLRDLKFLKGRFDQPLYRGTVDTEFKSGFAESIGRIEKDATG